MKKCKICEKEFVQFNSLQNTCSRECENEKKARKNERKKQLGKKVADEVKKVKKIAKTSKTNAYFDSKGNKYTKGQVDAMVSAAKEIVLERQRDEHGYNFCMDCYEKWVSGDETIDVNACKPIDCSHTISVKEAQEMRQVELAWDINNIAPRGRKCHQILDGLDLGSKSKK